MSADPPDGIHKEVYEKLFKEYKEALPEKLKAMKEILMRLKKNFNKEDFTSLRFIIHKFAGNAGMFGYQKVTDLCKQWDAKMTEMLNHLPETAPEGLLEEMEKVIQQIEKEFQNG